MILLPVNTNVLEVAMNILIDIRPLMDERYSGVAEYTFELLQAIFQLDKVNNYWLFYNSFHNVSHRLPVFDQANVEIVRTKFPNKIFNYALLKLLGRPYFDSLIGQPVDIFFMPHLNFASWSPKVRTVLTVHDISFIHFPEYFNWRKNVWHYLLSIKQLFNRCHTIVTLSDNTRSDVMRYGQILDNKVTTIFSGISDSFFRLKKDDAGLMTIKQKYNLPDNFILCLGTIEPRKNIEGLIVSFEIIKKDSCQQNLKLVIVGGYGWKAKSVYTQARKSVYHQDIIFLGYVAAKEKVYLYNAALLFIYPSFYEGFGFPPLEAMACGTPTIVSATSSLPEIVDSAALLIDPYNPATIAAAALSVLNDPELAQRLSLAGEQRAKEFQWEKTAEQYLELFTRIYERE